MSKKGVFLQVDTDEPAQLLKHLTDGGYNPIVRKWSDDWADLIRASMRPFLVVSSWSAIILMKVNQIPIDPWLMGIGASIAGEYFIERSVKGWKRGGAPESMTG
ncbi:hypothetical protein ES707_04062 [subsurface metagenome]